MTDGLLRFQRRTADVRGQNHIIFVGKRRLKRVAALLGLDREHVNGGTGQMAGVEMLLQRAQISNESTRQIDEDGVLLHVRELILAEEAGVRLAPVYVQSHCIRLLK